MKRGYDEMNRAELLAARRRTNLVLEIYRAAVTVRGRQLDNLRRQLACYARAWDGVAKNVGELCGKRDGAAT